MSQIPTVKEFFDESREHFKRMKESPPEYVTVKFKFDPVNKAGQYKQVWICSHQEFKTGGERLFLKICENCKNIRVIEDHLMCNETGSLRWQPVRLDGVCGNWKIPFDLNMVSVFK